MDTTSRLSHGVRDARRTETAAAAMFNNSKESIGWTCSGNSSPSLFAVTCSDILHLIRFPLH